MEGLRVEGLRGLALSLLAPHRTHSPLPPNSQPTSQSDDDYDANYTSLFWTEPTPCQWSLPWVNGSCGASNDYLLAIPDYDIHSQFGLEHKQ